jgi:hypothetical protein
MEGLLHWRMLLIGCRIPSSDRNPGKSRVRLDTRSSAELDDEGSDRPNSTHAYLQPRPRVQSRIQSFLTELSELVKMAALGPCLHKSPSAVRTRPGCPGGSSVHPPVAPPPERPPPPPKGVVSVPPPPPPPPPPVGSVRLPQSIYYVEHQHSRPALPESDLGTTL